MQAYQASFIEQELLPLGLEGKCLLEIGAGRGEICRALLTRVPSIRRIVGINVDSLVAADLPNWQMFKMDASHLGFQEASFDLIYSLATFEHIHDLPGALDEAYRVLRPGGLLVSVWSPIWNGFNGHHYGSTLSHESHRDIALPWAHHILSRSRLCEYLVVGEGFSSEEANRAVAFIHDSPWISRLGYGDYMRMLTACSLEPVRVDGVRVDFAGLLQRIEEKIASGHVRAEELINFFKQMPEDEILVYKMRVVMKR